MHLIAQYSLKQTMLNIISVKHFAAWNNNFQIWIKYYKVLIILQFVTNIGSFTAESNEITPTTSESRGTKHMKYVLLWESKGSLKNIFGEGQEGFIQNNCPVNNCFVSSDKYMFGGDLKQFDTILFNGWDDSWLTKIGFPEKRYYHQKYAFVQRESAAKTYVCHERFDNFFNWTITYKLDSDIVFPHIHVRDINMDVIGPTKGMNWITDMLDLDEEFAKDLETKTKAVAWFDSKCDPASNSSKYVQKLNKALKKYKLNIDVYGKCNFLHCPKHECEKMLDEEYYFYLALEDSFAEDYVTGSILRALRNNIVPIVYGGAKYDRFLPPHSYLDGTTQTPEALASLISRLVRDPVRYREHLRWKSHYSFCSGQGSPSLSSKGKRFCGQTMCELCEALHDSSLFKDHSVYEDFRDWWYPYYEENCPNLKNKPRKGKKGTNKLQSSRKFGNLIDETLKNSSTRKSGRRNEVLDFIDNDLPFEMRDFVHGAWPGDIHSVDLGVKLADRMFDRGFSIPGYEVPAHGGGGGGGGGVRTAGELAIETSRIRVSVMSNNFEVE